MNDKRVIFILARAMQEVMCIFNQQSTCVKESVIEPNGNPFFNGKKGMYE